MTGKTTFWALRGPSGTLYNAFSAMPTDQIKKAAEEFRKKFQLDERWSVVLVTVEITEEHALTGPKLRLVE